jgi:hypothetical protein
MLQYTGQPVDSGPTRDAGSRFDVSVDGRTDDYVVDTEWL